MLCLVPGPASTPAGWGSLPREENQPFVLEGPSYLLEGLLVWSGCSLPLVSGPSGVLIQDTSWGRWGVRHTPPRPAVSSKPNSLRGSGSATPIKAITFYTASSSNTVVGILQPGTKSSLNPLLICVHESLRHTLVSFPCGCFHT